MVMETIAFLLFARCGIVLTMLVDGEALDAVLET